MKISTGFLALAFTLACPAAHAAVDTCESKIAQHMKKDALNIISSKKLSESYNRLDMYEVRTRPVDGDGSSYWLVITTPDWDNQLNDCEIQSVNLAQTNFES